MFAELVNLGFPKKNILLIPNGINRTQFLEIKKPKRTNTHYGYVGRLTEFKNLRFLLDIFKKYLTKYPKDKLFIYGRGSEEGNILNFINKNNLEKNIIFVGFEKEKNKIYSNLDVIIDPALGQGISNTNLEAMSTKTLVIASNVIGNQDLIHDKRTGLLFNPFKKDDILSKLNYYKESSDLTRKLINNAEGEILLNYDIDVISRKIYESLKSKIGQFKTSKTEN